MRFSETGPDFPTMLVTELRGGGVVFLCGAGVSQRAGLPDFEKLVEQIYTAIGEDRDPFEQRAFEQQKFDECLGSLARRIVDERDIVCAATKLLQPAENASLDAHDIILRLSAEADGSPILVTTNFDTLFERAMRVRTGGPVRALSSAGSSIPAPGSKRFTGIVHLHGRLHDSKLELEETDLVLTSAQFGAAYLRDGWASRFIFDLTRSKTVVLIGYRAGDPPVRYILSVLDADRERFPDLKQVYAIASREQGETNESAVATWEALGVQPILYEPTDGVHSLLWDDLKLLANFIERPRAWLQDEFRQTLSAPFATTSEVARDRVVAVFEQYQEAWGVLAEAVEDSSWISFLDARGIIKELGLSQRALAVWARKRLGSLDAFQAILASSSKLREEFADVFLFSLVPEQTVKIDPVIALGWRLLCHSILSRKRATDTTRIPIFERIKKGSRLSIDLDQLIEIAAPRLEIRPHNILEATGVKSTGALRLRDICGRELSVDAGSDDLLNEALSALQPDDKIAVTLLDKATSRLIEVLRLGHDAALIREGLDQSDFDVPSIEAHQQNEHHNGLLPLVQLAVRFLRNAAAIDVMATRMTTERWHREGFRLTTRLWLHALREKSLYSDDEAISSLISLPPEILLTIPREVPLVVRDRLKGASSENVKSLIDLCLAGQTQLYSEPAQPDEPEGWREVARDRVLWRILSSAKTSGATLPDNAEQVFGEIKSRRDWLKHPLSDQDYFNVWMGNVRTVTGRPEILQSVPDEQKIVLAKELSVSADPEDQESWNAFCRSDFEGAKRTLLTRPVDLAIATLWAGWMWAIPSGPELDKQSIANHLESAFAHLHAGSNEFSDAITYDLVWGFTRAAEFRAPIAADWWERLWSSAERTHAGTAFTGSNRPDTGFNAATAILNSSGGRLADRVLQSISDRQPGERNALTPLEIHRIGKVIGSDSPAGIFGRGAFVMELPFLSYHAEQLIESTLIPKLNASTDEGAFLRSILIEQVALPPALVVKFWPVVLQAAEESHSTGRSVESVAATLLRGCFHFPQGNASDPSQRRASVRTLLRNGRDQLRLAIVSVLAAWLEHEKPEAQANEWTNIYGPLFRSVWPKARILKTPTLSNPLVRLLAASAEAFPQALGELRPYLLPNDQQWPHLPWRSDNRGLFLAEHFPDDMLALLWWLYGTNLQRSIIGLGAVLDAIRKTKPTVISDRRFHALEGMVLPSS